MNSQKPQRVPDVVIARLSLYLRTLEQLNSEKDEMISSRCLAERMAVTAVQIRKDLSHFGDFGKRGSGYHIHELIVRLRRILQTNRGWSVVLVGVGQLGRAIIGSKRLEQHGFCIDAIFDNNRTKIGRDVNGLQILHVNHLARSVESLQCRIGIICTPGSAAQRVADRLIEAGVESILNYAPSSLIVGENVRVQNIDPVASLRQMTYHMSTPAEPICPLMPIEDERVEHRYPPSAVTADNSSGEVHDLYRAFLVPKSSQTMTFPITRFNK